MKILGIETSCDETAASVVEDGTRLLSNVVVSQIDVHKEFGGVVPEIAARSHIEAVLPVIDKALTDAFPRKKDRWAEVDAIAVTKGPGLLGSLLIGTLTARSLALIKGKPLYGVHHVLGHVYANWITSHGPHWPAVERSSTRRQRSSRDASLSAAVLSPRSTSTASSASRSRLASRRSPNDVPSELPVANYQLPRSKPEFSLLALIVSGGHSQLVLFNNHFDYKLLGQTRDDAVGEAYDKVAKILGLPYPGGPAIDKLAPAGNPKVYSLPDAKLDNPYDFSFSGLKTAALRTAQKVIGEDYTFPSHQIAERLTDEQRADLAASFQEAAVTTMVSKTVQAYKEFQPAVVVIAGGVAANQALREALKKTLPINIEYAPMNLCTDNAAMIASLAYFHAQVKQPDDPMTLETAPSLSI